MITYEKFISSIKEGLIITHDIFQAENVIKKHLLTSNIENTIEIKSNNTLTVDINYNINKILIDSLLNLFNNLGYFPSLIYIENKNISNQYIFNYDKLIKDLNKNIIKIKFTLESTFDQKINNDYEKLFHITRVSFLDKIKKQGLIAKSKDKISYHPDRIYLSFNIKNCHDLIQKFKTNDILNTFLFLKSIYLFGFNIKYYEFTILEIDAKNIELFKDPNFSEKGCYTYDNISPNQILNFNI